MSFASLLNRTCTIEEKTTSQDSYGADTETYTVKYTNVPCRMSTKRSREIANAGRDKFKTNKYLLSYHALIVPVEYNVADNDRIILENEYYHVVIAEKDSNLHHWVLSIKKIT